MDESRLYAYCLQGDVVAAYEYIQSVPEKSTKQKKLEAKYFRRFFSAKPPYRFKSDDPWIRRVLVAYYQYFTAVLTRKSVLEAENQLRESLVELIPESTLKDNMDILEAYLEQKFKEKGYHFLGGVTPPYRGPYIWKTTTEKEFTVLLPHQVQKVTVYFMTDFLLQSWIHFATFGEKFAGGWAKEDGLYFVAERPKNKRVEINSSEFQVSYLKHEAQHQIDFARFPDLSPKDLEYRAKLVELIYEPVSFRLLKKFFYEKKDDSRLPHPHSAYVIMERLKAMVFKNSKEPSLEQWMKVDSALIQECAWKLYDEHTKFLEEQTITTLKI